MSTDSSATSMASCSSPPSLTDGAAEQDQAPPTGCTNTTTTSTTSQDDHNHDDTTTSTSPVPGDGSTTDNAPTADEATEQLQAAEKPWSAEKIEQHLEQARAFKDEGNRHYGAREWLLAIDRYTDAIHTAPPQHAELAVFYANRAAAKLQLSTPDHEDVIRDCSSALEVDTNYLKALVRRAQSYEKVDKPAQALEDYKRILEITPNSQLAREAVQRLPAVVNEKLERDKAEMLGKLKDLGNVVLGKLFGISLDNLQFQQDPESGSYSVSMRQ